MGRRADCGTVLDLSVTIHVCDGFSVRRVSQQFHRVGDDSFVGIDVSIASGRGNRFTKISEARLSFVLDDLVHAIDYETVREVPSQQRCREQELDA